MINWGVISLEPSHAFAEAIKIDNAKLIAVASANNNNLK